MTERVTPAFRPRIVVVLPRGEAIRNFVDSGALDHVANKADLTILTVVPNDEIYDRLQRRFADVRALTESPAGALSGSALELLDLAHGRVLWSEAARERWRRRDQEAVTPRQRAKRLLKKSAAKPFARQGMLPRLSRWQLILATRENAVRSARSLLRDLRPALVFNGSQVHSVAASPIMTAAALDGWRSATFCFSWDNLTSQGRIQPLPDHFLVWNEAIAADLRQIYPSVTGSQIEVTGTPQFDAHFDPSGIPGRAELCNLIGVDAARPFVLYTTGMANHMPGEPELVEDVADALAALDNATKPQLVVRVYAKDRTSRFRDLQRNRPDIVFTPTYWEPTTLTPLDADRPLWSGLLRHCICGVNVASTVSLELCMFDKAVVNLAYNPTMVPTDDIAYARYYDFDHYRPIVASGAVDVVRNKSELIPALDRALTTTAAGTACRRRLIDTMFGNTLDGQSATRVAEAIIDMAHPSV